jgi:5-methylcytosine-specific restriction enzyme subunit McrC
MPGVAEMRLTDSTFRRVVLGRNSGYYRFLVDVCEIVHRNLLVDETTGETSFRDFTRDDKQMARLFEKFLYNFTQRSKTTFAVGAPRLDWLATGAAEDLAYLPEMRTDIVLRGHDQVIVIDAKYYSETLAEHFSKVSIRSGHLYQIYAYLSHLSMDRVPKQVRGILIYPRTTAVLGVRVTLSGYPLHAATINLAQPWNRIKQHLLDMLASA